MIDRAALQTCEQALDLAALIVRAGAKDGLDWWEDEALTPSGALVLRRIFPRAADRLARRLALLAAQERQAGALRDLRPSVLTLLDLPAESLEARHVPADPIPSLPALREGLLGI